MPTDADLLARYSATQDQDAFSILVKRYHNRAISAVRRRVRDRDTAEDIVQRGWMRVAAHSHEFDPSRSEFITWFHFMLDKLSNNLARDKSRRPQFTGSLRSDSKVDNAPIGLEAELDELRDGFWNFVNSLDADKRNAVCAIYVAKMTYREAAQTYGVSKRTIEKRIASVQTKLRQALGGEMPNFTNFSLERRAKPRHQSHLAVYRAA